MELIKKLNGQFSEWEADAADGETTGTVADVGIVSEPAAQHAAALLLCASIAKIGDFLVQMVRLFPLFLPLIFFTLARLSVSCALSRIIICSTCAFFACCLHMKLCERTMVMFIAPISRVNSVLCCALSTSCAHALCRTLLNFSCPMFRGSTPTGSMPIWQRC